MEEEILEQPELEISDNEETTLQETTEVEPSQDEDNQQLAYWQQHENAKKGFWKTEQDVINSVDYYQKKFKPFETVLGQRGIKDVDGLSEILNKYDEYSNPESEINLTYQSIQNLMQHPQYGQKFNDFVSGIIEEAEVEKYGNRLSPELREKLQKIDALEAKEKEREYQAQVQNLEGELDKSINQIKEFCQSKGLEITDDELKNHIQDCIENNIGINRVYENFLVKNLDKLLGNVQAKTSQSLANNLQKNAKGAVNSGSRISPASEISLNSSQDLRSALQEALK